MTISPQSVPRAVDLSAVKAALWLSGTVVLALLVYYFVGIDQGATSVFGTRCPCLPARFPGHAMA